MPSSRINDNLKENQNTGSRRIKSREPEKRTAGVSRGKKNGGPGILPIILLIFAAAIIISAAAYEFIIRPEFTAEFAGGPEEEEEQAEEETAEEVTDIYLERLLGIKESLTRGDSVLKALRLYYPEDLVIYKDNRYIFVPVDDSLKKHSYSSGYVTELSTGEYVYDDGSTATKKGIDVSSHQGEIDWEQVAAAGMDFAIIRALYRGYGSGKLVEDEQFAANLKGAGENGIDIGVYIFTQAITEEEVDEEIAMLKELLGGTMPDFPVVVDVEEANGGEGRMDYLSVDERTSLIKYYCERLKEEGYTPMIYYNMGGAVLMVDLSELEEYRKWFAVYDADFYYPYDYSVWQYSDTGTVDGIEGYVDLDIAFGEW